MTTKLHDLTKIREELKNTATTVRNLRTEARATSHEARHNLKVDANSYAHWTRHELLAYGYLRGLSIREMESPFTTNHAAASQITKHAAAAFRARVEETPEEREAAWKEFCAHIESDVKSWNNECRLRVMQRAAELASREVA